MSSRLATGSIPFMMISWIQSQALSRRTSTDMYLRRALGNNNTVETKFNNYIIHLKRYTLDGHLFQSNSGSLSILSYPKKC